MPSSIFITAESASAYASLVFRMVSGIVDWVSIVILHLRKPCESPNSTPGAPGQGPARLGPIRYNGGALSPHWEAACHHDGLRDQDAETEPWRRDQWKVSAAARRIRTSRVTLGGATGGTRAYTRVA